MKNALSKKQISVTMSPYFEDVSFTQSMDHDTFKNIKAGDKVHILHQGYKKDIYLTISSVTSNHIYGRFLN